MIYCDRSEKTGKLLPLGDRSGAEGLLIMKHFLASSFGFWRVINHPPPAPASIAVIMSLLLKLLAPWPRLSFTLLFHSTSFLLSAGSCVLTNWWISSQTSPVWRWTASITSLRPWRVTPVSRRRFWDPRVLREAPSRSTEQICWSRIPETLSTTVNLPLNITDCLPWLPPPHFPSPNWPRDWTSLRLTL